MYMCVGDLSWTSWSRSLGLNHYVTSLFRGCASYNIKRQGATSMAEVYGTVLPASPFITDADQF
jgi:hypothetical protein